MFCGVAVAMVANIIPVKVYWIVLTVGHIKILRRCLAHSKNEIMQWRGVRRLSVRPSVCLSVNFCANCFFSQTNGWIDTKLVRWTPGQLASRVCSRSRSRSKVTWYEHFCACTKMASSRGKLDRDQTCTRWSPGKPASRVFSRSRSWSTVTWYAHFLWFLEWATPSWTVWF